MATGQSHTIELPELWMELDDKRRKRLRTLMEIHDMSPKALALRVGWKSRTSVTRLLSGRYNTVEPDRAVRIAKVFDVPVNDLFLTRESSVTGDFGQRESA